MKLKIYLGDSVYAEYDPEAHMMRIYTDNGYGPHNEIFLEPAVRIALAQWLENNDLN